MTTRWIEVESDAKFAALFDGKTIVRATTYVEGLPDIDADMYWLLSSGLWLAMKIQHSGCNTCGFGAGDKTYWTYLDAERMG